MTPKAINVRLSDASHAALTKFGRVHGVTLAGLFEALGCLWVDGVPTPEDVVHDDFLSDLVAEARAVDAVRRSRSDD